MKTKIITTMLTLVTLTSCSVNNKDIHYSMSDADYSVMSTDYVQLIDYSIDCFRNKELIISGHIDYYNDAMKHLAKFAEYIEPEQKDIILDFYDKIIDIASYEADYIQHECTYAEYADDVTNAITSVNYIFKESD